MLMGSLISVGQESDEYIKGRVNPGEAVDSDIKTNELEEQKKKEMDLYKKAIKIPIGIHSDTPIGTLLDESGLLEVKTKNIEEDKKTETNLKNSGLPSDPLNVGISKIIKAKIENNSTPGTSPEEINIMMIEIMEDIEDQDNLFDSTEEDSDDAVKEIDASIDLGSYIEKILETNDKLADQKIINIKSNLNRAESEKKYLEAIINASKDAESKGGFLTDAKGIRDAKARLEENEKTINNLEAELQQYEDGQGEVSEEITGEVVEEVTEEIVDSEEESEEVTEEVVGEVITLNGTYSGPEYPDFGSFTMYMSIDLKTGTVSGMGFVKLKNENVDLDYDFPISGNMNLETREITGKFGDDKMNGKLSADGNRAIGTGSEGVVWSVSR